MVPKSVPSTALVATVAVTLLLAGCRKSDVEVFGFGADGIQLPYEASMVGSETCGLCHQDHVEWQETNHMAQSGRLVTPENRHRWFSDEQLARPTKRPASAVSRGPRFRRTEGGVALEHDGLPPARVDAIFGSGAHGLTPVEINGATAVRELSVSFLAGPGIWIPTPGQEMSLESLGHVMPDEDAARCVGCHATGLAWKKGKLDVEGSAVGVQCERCHGPGSAHVEAMVRRKEDVRIFNPASLPSKQQVEFCGQCHRKVSDLDPDQILNDTPETARHAGTALMLSACFTESPPQNSISCLDCHDPHQNISADDPFNAACLNCHTSPLTDHTESLDASADCVRCHMKKTRGLGHIEFTSHWIRSPAQGIVTEDPQRRQLVSHLDSAYREVLRDEQLGPMAKSDVLVRTAMTTAMLGQPGAAQDLAAALALQPRYAARLKIATEYSRAGDANEAVRVVEAAIEAEPRRSEAFERLVKLYDQRGDPERSIQTVLSWSQRIPGDVRLGQFLMSQNRFDEAEAHFRRGLEIEPQSAASHVQLGNLRRRRGEFAESVEHYRRAVDIAPEYVDAFVKLGQTLSAGGDASGALVHLQRAVSLDPASGPAHAELGMVLARTGDYEAASAQFEAALVADSTSSRAHWGMGRVRESQGDLAAAAAHYRTSAGIRANPEVFSRLAWILATAPDEGVRDGSEAVRLARQGAEMTRYKDPMVLSILAAAFTEVGAFDSARSIARRGLALIESDSTPAASSLRRRLEGYTRTSVEAQRR